MENKMNAFGILLLAVLLVSPAGFAADSTQGYLPSAYIYLHSGWNMVSVPVNEKISMSDMANSCGTPSYAWRMTQSGYVKEDTLVPGYGYWVKGTQDCNFAIGDTRTAFDIAGLFPGWNLVGAPRSTVPISSFKNNCDITSGPWYYSHPSNSYVSSDALVPGQAYWIKVSSSCTLGGETPPPPPDGNKAPVITSVGGPANLQVNTAGTWSVSAYDPENGQLTYYVSWGDEPAYAGGNPTGAKKVEISQSSTFTHTYYNAGTYTVSIKVADNQGLSAQTTASVNVLASGQQTFSTVPPTGANSVFSPGAQAMMAVQIRESDGTQGTPEEGFHLSGAIDGDLTMRAISAIAVSYNYQEQRYELRFTAPSISNQYSLQVTASCTGAGSSCQQKYGNEQEKASLKFTVSGNQPPVIGMVSAPASLSVGQQGTWTISAYDPENGQLTYSVVWGDEYSGATAPAKVAVWQGQTATLTHTYSQAGAYTATFTVTDDYGLTAQTSSTTSVGAGQTSGTFRVLTPDGGEKWVPGKQYVIGWTTAGVPSSYFSQYPTIQVVDSSGNSVRSYQSDRVFAGSEDNNFGQAYFTPSGSDVGNSYKFKVVLGSSSGFTGNSDGSADIVQNAPQRACLGTTSTVSGSYDSSFRNIGLDISGHSDILRYRIQWYSGGWSDWYTPGVDDVNWKTNDDGSKSRVWGYFSDHSYMYEKCVPASTNRAPVITSVGGPTNLQTGANGTWTLSASDPEGGQLTYYINWGDEASVPVSDRASTVTQSSSMTHVYYTSGFYAPTFTVVDDQGASATASVSVNVAGNPIVCQPQPTPACPSRFVSYQYTDSSGCKRFGCMLAGIGIAQQ